MDRIFRFLAAFAFAFMAATLILGMSLGNVRDPADEVTQRWATIHRLSGIAAGLVVVLVDSIVVTYFIGTSRWCREVVDTYQLDQRLTDRINKIKRRAFPISALSMLTVVGIVALGGAADPAAAMQIQPVGGLSWATMHLLGAFVGLTFIVYAFFVQWQAIEANKQLIDEVMSNVRAIRTERGLDVT